MAPQFQNRAKQNKTSKNRSATRDKGCRHTLAGLTLKIDWLHRLGSERDAQIKEGASSNRTATGRNYSFCSN